MVIILLFTCFLFCSCVTEGQQNNEVIIISETTFMIYKKVITKQDASQCIFYPTCSQYMAEAVAQHGIKGVFMGIDRLHRCHPLNIRDQKFYEKTASGKLYDPVK